MFLALRQSIDYTACYTVLQYSMRKDMTIFVMITLPMIAMLIENSKAWI